MIRISVSLRYNAALNFKKNISLILLLFVFLSGKSQYYSGSDIEFGQNRVQYNMFFGNLMTSSDLKFISNKAAENMLFIQLRLHTDIFKS